MSFTEVTKGFQLYFKAFQLQQKGSREIHRLSCEIKKGHRGFKGLLGDLIGYQVSFRSGACFKGVVRGFRGQSGFRRLHRYSGEFH